MVLVQIALDFVFPIGQVSMWQHFDDTETLEREYLTVSTVKYRSRLNENGE